VLPPVSATTASCASPFASLQLRFHTRCRVSAAWTIRGWSVDLPDVTLANLSLDASSPTPGAPEVHSPVSSLWTSAFPEFTAGRRLAMFHAATSARGRISGLQTFLYVKASSFARHPGRSHRCSALLGHPCSCLRRRVTIFALSMAKWGHISSIAPSECGPALQGSRGLYSEQNMGRYLTIHRIC
jgi:hypothetical protein